MIWESETVYEEGDIVTSGDSYHVYSGGTWVIVPQNSHDTLEAQAIKGIDELHKKKELPCYADIMKEFYNNFPEYLL